MVMQVAVIELLVVVVVVVVAVVLVLVPLLRILLVRLHARPSALLLPRLSTITTEKNNHSRLLN